MKALTLLMFSISTLFLFGIPESNAAAACESDGDVQFLCGPVSPEDLAIVPQSPWVIASGMEDDGALYLIDVRDHSSTTLYPTESSRPQLDTANYGACPGPVSGQFRPHGLSLHTDNNGAHTLYVVRHGEREAIEIFDINVGSGSPSLTWVGCVVAPDTVSINSVVALPDRGFAITNFQLPGGELWEWQRTSGWAKVPGSETSGPNGIEISADGRWFYIGGWGTRSLIRLSRGVSPVQKDVVEVSHHIDNVRWAPDGSLFAAGHVGPTPNAIIACMSQNQCEGVTSRVTRVDPQNLTAEEIIRYPSNDLLILGTVAIQVGEEIWVGGIAGSNRIARFQAP
jgi:hypothetical protein